ncbi:barstar family protein [Candidatus Venteria ishoeyi]|uniref:barstar family protein n=1 Tax=Candidatus Venteria ishoeyi TaxID=1899563 RepID=UPI0025A62305|nr:barstar family protein [Candidatus Venteria ishoeyi]MDM8547603.1 barstar family protein [Candidatus Venteria ishoeyi]
MNPVKPLNNLAVHVSDNLSPILSKPFLIDGNIIEGKESFFNEFSKKLQFPDFFGKNWDGFYDCITDLSWLNTQESYLIIYENPFNFQLKNTDDWKIANEILLDAVNYWKQQGKPMVIVFL